MSAPQASAAHGGVRLRSSRGRVPVFALLGGIGLVAAAAVRLFGLDHLRFSLCTFKALTGVPCMSCGTTRSIGLLAGGEPLAALTMNPLATLAVIGLATLALVELATYLAAGRSLRFSASPAAARTLRIVIPAMLVANWAYLIAMGR